MTGNGLLLLPGLLLLMLFLVPATVSLAWPGPGHVLDPIEREVVELVNKERKAAGLKPYIVNYSLQEAAWRHTEHMAKNKVMCHQGCGDGDPAQRIKATGYKAATWGENVASGQRTAAEVMDDWMHSSGHRANIMKKDFTDIGVAYASGGAYGTSWTQVFGVPAGGYATVTPPAGGAPGPALCSVADVNGDKKVTQEDVREVASRMGARTGDSRFSAKSDVVADGLINVQDTFKVLINVGLTCPN
jgi:hypothetical protein